jgi:hypothetical protein
MPERCGEVQDVRQVWFACEIDFYPDNNFRSAEQNYECVDGIASSIQS